MISLPQALRQIEQSRLWPWWRRYRRQARRPVHCLLFLVPLAALYELGAWWVVGGHAAGRELLAPRSIREVLGWIGLLGFWVPAVVLLVTLLVWHRVSRDRWQAHAWVLPGMLLESLVLTVPLLVLAVLFPQPSELLDEPRAVQFVKALGAGVYEELVFRLLLISALVWLLAEFARVRGPATTRGR